MSLFNSKKSAKILAPLKKIIIWKNTLISNVHFI